MATNDPTPVLIPAAEPQPVGEYIPRELAQVRALARVLDSAVEVPGTKFRIGLDAVIGLIPGIGDLISMLVGGYILTTAARLGVPRAVLGRMLVNLGTDAVVGSVPVIGDVLDAAWRANSKNVRLLEQALAEPKRAARSSTWMLVGLGAAVFAIGIGGLALAIWLAMLLADAVRG
jgi:hypothetical protein